MCQEQVINYLKKRRGRKVDINELMRVIPVSRQNISRACSRLAKFREIRVEQIRTMGGIKYLFSC